MLSLHIAKEVITQNNLNYLLTDIKENRLLKALALGTLL